MPDSFFKPVSGFDLPRFAGVPTFMRLPNVTADHPRFGDVDIGLIGVPWDSGTTNRPGPRHGPRQVRDASTMIRAQHPVFGTRPFEIKNIADLGDVGPNPADIHDSMDRITEFYKTVMAAGIKPLHFDSHTDLFDSYFNGTKYTHGTPFRRAVEENLLDPKRVVQIGIRGTQYDSEDVDFAMSVGIRIIRIEEFFKRDISDLMEEVREIIGDQETYVSYDIDFVDPTFAPGTGTPEVGGPNSFQALQVVRELKGLNIVGADMVEVSPPFDATGNTAFLGASIMFEMLCQMVNS